MARDCESWRLLRLMTSSEQDDGEYRRRILPKWCQLQMCQSRKWRPTCGFELLQFDSKVFEHNSIWFQMSSREMLMLINVSNLSMSLRPAAGPSAFLPGRLHPKDSQSDRYTAEVPQIKEERLMQIVWRNELIQKSLRRRVSSFLFIFCNYFLSPKPHHIAWHLTSFDGQFGVFEMSLAAAGSTACACHTSHTGQSETNTTKANARGGTECQRNDSHEKPKLC